MALAGSTNTLDDIFTPASARRLWCTLCLGLVYLLYSHPLWICGPHHGDVIGRAALVSCVAIQVWDPLARFVWSYPVADESKEQNARS